MDANLSLPSELFESFKHIESFNREEFIEAHQNVPSLAIRLNPFKPSDAFFNEVKVPWCANAYYLSNRPNFTADPLLHAGCYYVQEASSMFLAHALGQILNFEEQLLCLDLCASPGGKSTLLSSMLHEDSLLISNEVIQNRVASLSENLCKWGQLNTWVTNNDPKHFRSLLNMFDLVLVDAPCSGSGLFRKMPDYCTQWTPDLVNLCAQRQERILHDIYSSIKDNGILVYMTCSFSKQENENMVDYILRNFEVDSCQIQINKEWGIVETESEILKGYGYRFFPHLLNGEGFFLACFRKKELNSPSTKIENTKVKRNENEFGSLTSFVDCTSKIAITQNDYLFLLHAKHFVYAELFSKHLKLIKRGVFCGKIIRGELIPEHELAMYSGCLKSVNAVELTYYEAIKYLQKEHIEIPNLKKAWNLVRFENHNLGWVKNLGNRVNNYYPSAYRILNKNILTTR